jgi:branched-chain amino acid transport system ATP-binding protein
MLKVRDLNVNYKNIQVLKGVSIDVREGELVTVIGSNGAGKSTFLMTLCGVIKQTSGTTEFLGICLDKLEPHQIFSLGMVQVPQDGGLFPEMTILENLRQGAYRSPAVKNIGQKLEEIYGYFPVLTQRKNQRVGTLSGGERQMLAIGRALMASPKLLILDEPGSGLAPLIVEHLAMIIDNLHKQGLTILLVEQNAYLALELADRGFVLENGHITMSGKAPELLHNELVKKAYLGA